MSVGSWANRFAFYAASQYRLGNIYDAGFVSAVLFEKYIEDEMKRNGLEKSVNGEFLFDAISQLSEFDSRRYDAVNLNSLRKIRNRSVIHNDDFFEHYNNVAVKQNISKDIRKLVDFVWKRLDPEGVVKHRDIDAIPHIHADFAVMGVREFFQDNRHQISANQHMILPEDFNDLLHMRKHFLQLGEYLQKGILKKYKNLEVDLVSHVDTSSGYVWLAVNHTRPSPDHLRDRIRHSSASIFATPLYLRISIDFGGEDYLSREDYYRFLATEEAITFIQAHPKLKILDLEWYAFVTQANNAESYAGSENYSINIGLANSKLLNDIQDNKIITWERLLLGFIISKIEIRYDEIASYLANIIELYYRLERFRRDTLNRNNRLDWTPRWI